MGPMEAFIHYENLIIFKKRLADPNITDEQRELLVRLLAQEQAKHFHDRDDGPAKR